MSLEIDTPNLLRTMLQSKGNNLLRLAIRATSMNASSSSVTPMGSELTNTAFDPGVRSANVLNGRINSLPFFNFFPDNLRTASSTNFRGAPTLTRAKVAKF